MIYFSIVCVLLSFLQSVRVGFREENGPIDSELTNLEMVSNTIEYALMRVRFRRLKNMLL